MAAMSSDSLRHPFINAQQTKARARRRARIARSLGELATGFRALAGAPGATPWDPASLSRFAAAQSTAPEARLAAGLLLRLWHDALEIGGVSEPGDARYLLALTPEEWRTIQARWVQRGPCGG
jgi:hypothetical protein